MLLITHDPHLVELVADRLWLVADGTVRPFEGDLDDYRGLLAERARAAAVEYHGVAMSGASAQRRGQRWRPLGGGLGMRRHGWRDWRRSVRR